MNRSLSIIKSALIILACVLALPACRHKEFDDVPDPNVKVRVVYHWDDEEVRDVNPAGMVAFFYDSRNGDMRRFDFHGRDGGVIELPQGDWHIITFNNDSEIVQSYGYAGFATHTGFTRIANALEGALGPNASGNPISAAEDEKVVATPDEMWGESREMVPVYVDPATEEAVVDLYPHPLTCHYSYEIRNISNLEHVVNLCGSLSGMAGELNFSSEELSRERVTLPFAGYKGDATTIRGDFFTFGHHELNPEPHRMTLYLWMDDGRKLAYGTTRASHWDVTDQVHDAPDRRRVHIIIDGLDLAVEEPLGGLAPGADDWGEEDRYLPI